ncbi:MAG: TolC family protein [Betaproteobacteria bacterium]|nr:TolC family protein [Betaproteobacteria bacterium]MBI2509587.1 TolC family protein [Betaproteobacteria bacterium]
MLGLTGLILPVVAVPAAEGMDPFGTGRYMSPAPHLKWESSLPLPEVKAAPSARLPDSARPLSLPELTEFALQNNPKTRQAWYAARAAAANVGIEQADLLPQLTANFNRTRLQNVSSNTGALGPAQTRYGPSFALSYVLFDFGARADQVEAAEYRLLAANLAQNRVLQDVIFQVEHAYYQLLGIDALVKTNEMSLKNNQTALEAAQKRRESGLATVADVYRAETAVAQAQLNLTRGRGDLQKAKGQLASAVGLPVNQFLQVQVLSAPPRAHEIVQSIDGFLQRAKSTRPDLVAAEAQARAARAAANATAKAGLPSIEFTGNTARTLFDNRPGANTFNLTFNLRIPLFSGFRDTYQIRQAEAQAQQAEAARDALYKQTELDVWQAYFDLQTAVSGIASTEAQVRSAEQTAQATLARYQAGFGSILDLITAQQDESSARVQRIQSYLDWFTALARLNFSMGASDILALASDKK